MRVRAERAVRAEREVKSEERVVEVEEEEEVLWRRVTICDGCTWQITGGTAGAVSGMNLKRR